MTLKEFVDTITRVHNVVNVHDTRAKLRANSEEFVNEPRENLRKPQIKSYIIFD